MQENQEIGKIANVAPLVIAKSLELFVQELVNDCVKDIRREGGKGKLTASNVKRAMMAKEKYQFLDSVVADIPLEVNNNNG